MNKFHFGTQEEVIKKYKCCDNPDLEETWRDPPDEDFYVHYRCQSCGQKTVDYYKWICMEEQESK